jgi:heptosyltransferase-2
MDNRPSPPRRILVRGVNWLGDAVMTTPALLRLRAQFPAAHIALLVPQKLQDLWRHHPALDEVLTFAPETGLWQTAKRLRAGRFDLALALPNSPRSALEIFLAGIPERAGYARAWRGFLLNHKVLPRAERVAMRKRSASEAKALAAAKDQSHPQEPVRRVLTDPANLAHQMHEYLHLAAALGASADPLPPQLCVMPDEVAAAQKKFGVNLQPGLVLGLNPGAEYGPAKRWPAERFIATALAIQAKTRCTWVILGGPRDMATTAQIHAAIGAQGPTLNLAGQTTLRELMAVLKLCRVLLTNDTGPMHVAAALGTPVVVPFGSTSPELTGPGLPGDRRHHLLTADAGCAPCFLRECPIDFRCMQRIGAERVVEAVMAALESES